MAQNNIACRIFKEQIDLIQQLPKNERAVVLYSAIMQAFNQFDNQNENQNECAYVSVSVSVLGKCILDLLSKNIAFKEFSSNYGGKRPNAGKPKNVTPVTDSSRSCTQNANIAKTYWGNERYTDDKRTYNEGQPITIPLPDHTITIPIKKEIIKEKKTKGDFLYIGNKQTIKMTQKEFDEISNTAGNPLILIKLLADMEEYIVNSRKKPYESYYLACLKWLRKGIAIDSSIDFDSESKRLNLPLTTLQKRIISESGEGYENK